MKIFKLLLLVYILLFPFNNFAFDLNNITIIDKGINMTGGFYEMNKWQNTTIVFCEYHYKMGNGNYCQ